MSLIGFDTLRAAHPEQSGLISRLEKTINLLLSVDQRGVIDDKFLEQKLSEEASTIKMLLVELVQERAIRPRFFWNCPNGKGVTLEADSLKEFPLSAECDRCGDRHEFIVDDVEVQFLATEALLKDVQSSGSL